MDFIRAFVANNNIRLKVLLERNDTLVAASEKLFPLAPL
jgi:hypothetical protein